MYIAYLVLRADYLSGGMRVVFEHAERLRARGHKVEIWSMEKYGEPAFSLGVPVFLTEDTYGYTPDILVITAISCLAPALAEIKAKFFFFLIQHDLALLEELQWSREAATRVDEAFSRLPASCRLISVSSWVREVLLQKYGRDSLLVRNGVDRKLFYPATPLAPPTSGSILFFYDPQSWKGAPEVFNVAAIIRSKFPGTRVLAVGKFFPDFGQQDGAIFNLTYPLTFFSRPDQADLAAISSSWTEGFGLPGLEAMTCGVPVVTTDSGGVRDYAINEETALVVPPRNPQALADAVIRLLCDEPLRKKLIKNGLAKAAGFDWEKSIDILEREFKNI